MPDPIDTDDLRRMLEARIGPHVTCPASRHAAMIAEALTAGDQDQQHQGGSIAATVAALWEARADLSALRASEAEMRAEIERLRRNNDMWRGQCERQAVSLTEMRAALRGLLSDCDLSADRPELIAARAALSQPASGEGAS